MMKRIILALVPAILMGLTLWGSASMPKGVEFLESALNPDIPLDYELEGWYGQRTQESAAERKILAEDTRFSKGLYLKRRDDPDAPRNPTISLSLIYSGNDMNHSIHRPEGCLPAQGHLSLTARSETLQLADGRKLTFTRLASLLPDEKNPREYVHYIHYYVFVGHNAITHNHLARVFRDIRDRATSGRVQRWAYFQAGVCWGGSTGYSEEPADAQLREFISQIMPQLIDWELVGR